MGPRPKLNFLGLLDFEIYYHLLIGVYLNYLNSATLTTPPVPVMSQATRRTNLRRPDTATNQDRAGQEFKLAPPA